MAIKIINADCLAVIDSQPKAKCIFMDPPDNIGLTYDVHADKTTDTEYLRTLGQIIKLSFLNAETVWVSFNAKWTLHLASEITRIGLRQYTKPMVQTFTFGQHSQTDFSNDHRPLWRIRRSNIQTLTDNIRVKSWRQENGDKRADPRGRVPGDVFDFTRVTGNSAQRRTWHPTQLNELLVERCILSCTQPGDLVIDPFAGTGTTGRVCKKLFRDCILIEKSANYCELMSADF